MISGAKSHRPEIKQNCSRDDCDGGATPMRLDTQNDLISGNTSGIDKVSQAVMVRLQRQRPGEMLSIMQNGKAVTVDLHVQYSVKQVREQEEFVVPNTAFEISQGRSAFAFLAPGLYIFKRAWHTKTMTWQILVPEAGAPHDVQVNHVMLSNAPGGLVTGYIQESVEVFQSSRPSKEWRFRTPNAASDSLLASFLDGGFSLTFEPKEFCLKSSNDGLFIFLPNQRQPGMGDTTILSSDTAVGTSTYKLLKVRLESNAVYKIMYLTDEWNFALRDRASDCTLTPHLSETVEDVDIDFMENQQKHTWTVKSSKGNTFSFELVPVHEVIKTFRLSVLSI